MTEPYNTMDWMQHLERQRDEALAELAEMEKRFDEIEAWLHSWQRYAEGLIKIKGDKSA